MSAAAGSHRLPAASADADAGLVHHAAQTGASCRSMGAKAYGVLPMGSKPSSRMAHATSEWHNISAMTRPMAARIGSGVPGARNIQAAHRPSP